MYTLFKSICLFILLLSSFINGQYISINNTISNQYYFNGFCQSPLGGKYFSYNSISNNLVKLIYYNDKECTSLYSSVVFQIGTQPNGDILEVLENIKVDTPNTKINVVYGNGTSCSGTISYANVQPTSICIPLDINNPTLGSQIINCDSDSPFSGYTQFIYYTKDCTEGFQTRFFNSYSSCNGQGSGSYVACNI